MRISANPGAMVGLGILLAHFSAAVRQAARTPEFRGLLVVAVGLVITGTLVFSTTEHWSVVNGLYFAVSTLTTTSPNGLALTHTFSKLFTVVYILFGIGVLAEFVRQIANAHGELRQKRRARRSS